jgi:hypothetical protein
VHRNAVVVPAHGSSPSQKPGDRTLAVIHSPLALQDAVLEALESRILAAGFQIVDARLVEGDEAVNQDLDEEPNMVYVLQRPGAVHVC